MNTGSHPNPSAAPRSAARKWLASVLPPAIRKPLGSLWGCMDEAVLRPLLGLWFDLSGGRFCVDGCVFQIPRDATRLGFRACFLTQQYEVDERLLIPKYLAPTDSVLELGACLGVVSCITHKRLRSPARHVVVEANPFCLPALYRNRALNQAGFLIEHCAVTPDREAVFRLHPRFITGSSIQNEAGIPVRVPCRSLQDLWNRHGPFSVLIMDIEGGELAVLQSAPELLPKFRLIILEVHEWVFGPAGVQQCHSLLAQAGFRLAERSYVTEAWIKAAPSAPAPANPAAA